MSVLHFLGDMDRSIPHIRNIFSTSSRKKSTSDTQDLCQYEKSPRSRKKSNKELDHDHKNTGSPKKAFDFGKENLKSSDEHRKSGNKNGNYNTYTSKSLTEKDMKHLERHLSMKKTIRKQISRNLAQAFLDNPNIFEPADDKSTNHKADHALPPLGDKQGIAKTEQNVLDLLKISIDDRDSGHSSPTHENLDDTDYEDDPEDLNTWRSSSSKHRSSDTKGLMEDDGNRNNREPEKKSSSIWKMFSPRHKGKR